MHVAWSGSARWSWCQSFQHGFPGAGRHGAVMSPCTAASLARNQSTPREPHNHVVPWICRWIFVFLVNVASVENEPICGTVTPPPLTWFVHEPVDERGKRPYRRAGEY